MRALALLAAALCAGGASLARRLESASASRPEREIQATLEGSVAAVVRRGGSFRVELRDVWSVDPAGARVPSRVHVLGAATRDPVGSLERALPGDRLRVRAVLRAPRDRHNPGGRGRARRLDRAGVGAEARLVHPALHARVVDREGPRPLSALHALRARAAERLEARGEAGALLAALALGERAGLGLETRDAFSLLGLSHLLAVSGLNLAMLAALVFAGVRRGLVRSAALAARFDVRTPALALAAAFAVAHALLAGFDVPVRRALVLVLATAASVASVRPARRGHPLALAALVILVGEPEALFDAGAQMSFAASAALSLAARPRAARPPGRGRWRARVADLLSPSASAILATGPLAAFHLGVVSPFALLVNVVAVPWTGWLVLPLSLVAALAAGAAPGGLGAVLAVALPPAQGTLAAVHAVARAVPAAPLTPAPGPGVVACALALAMVGLAVRSVSLRVVACIASVALLATAPVTPIAPEPPRLVILDVGRGDAVLVQGREGTLLVDAGTALAGRFDHGRSVVAPALAALGVERLDLVVASHADLDHRGGLPALLGRLPVGGVWLPHGGASDPDFAPLLDAARRAGVLVQERGAGDAASSAGDLRVTPLWPPRICALASRNDRSLVVRVEVGSHRVLLAGDLGRLAEAELVASGADLGADVLLLPHHGSGGSSSRRFLAAVDPLLAVASAPCGGRFAWPHRDTLARVRAARIPLWWTGRDGAVVVGLGRPLVARGFGPIGARCEGSGTSRGGPGARGPDPPGRGTLARIGREVP